MSEMSCNKSPECCAWNGLILTMFTTINLDIMSHHIITPILNDNSRWRWRVTVHSEFQWTKRCASSLLCSRVSLTEVVGQLSAADLLSFLSKLQSVLGDFFTRNVGRHDEDGVFTLDGLPLTVCEATLRERETLNKVTFANVIGASQRYNMCVCLYTHTSSKSCNMIVRTSGWALSTSSNRTTALGHAFNSLVSWPPSSCPTYPGGEPINFATWKMRDRASAQMCLILFMLLQTNPQKLNTE